MAKNKMFLCSVRADLSLEGSVAGGGFNMPPFGQGQVTGGHHCNNMLTTTLKNEQPIQPAYEFTVIIYVNFVGLTMGHASAGVAE